MTIEAFCDRGPFATNSYLVIDDASGHCAVIDPTWDTEPMLDLVRTRGLSVAWILNTHGHCDHIVNNRMFVEATGAPLALHRDDLDFVEGLEDQLVMFGLAPASSPPPDRFLVPGETVEVGTLKLEVRHTPGHSPGSVSFVVGDVVIAGDTLFAGSIGRVDLPGGDLPTLLTAIRTQLFTLSEPTRVLSGHGPETSIGVEKRTNPFLTE